MSIETPIYYTDGHGNEFTVLSLYAPNEEPDTWVRYQNVLTEQEYTCRLEAFHTRFTVLPPR
jgi:hypothetical protein